MTKRRAHVWTASGLLYITIEGDWPDPIQRGPYLYALDRFHNGAPAVRHGRVSGVEIANYYPIPPRRGGAVAPPPEPITPGEPTADEPNRTHTGARRASTGKSGTTRTTAGRGGTGRKR